MSVAPRQEAGGRRLGTAPPGHEVSCSLFLHCQLPGRCLQSGSCLASGIWQLLLLFFCGPGLVKFSGLLLASRASHCLWACMPGLCVLWSGILQVGRGLTLILARKLCSGVLWPVQQAVWQLLTIVWGWRLQLLPALIRGTRCCVLQLWRFCQWQARLTLLSMAQWTYFGMVSLHHENSKALEPLPQAVLEQVAVSLLFRCLDRVWVAMWGRGLRFPGWTGPHWRASEDLDGVTAVLPATTIPFSRRFPGRDPSALSRLSPASISLCLVGRDKSISSFGATKVPFTTSFQSSRTSDMVHRSSPKQALAQQVKTTCFLIVLLYFFAASLFVQILK